MARDDPVYVEIRWPDIDWYGHVSHMALVAIAEHGRSRWLDATLGIQPATWPYVVARLELDFRASVGFVDRSIHCRYKPVRVGTKSVSLEERYTGPDDTLVLEARSVIVAWDQERSVTRALTDDEASRLAPHSE
jgi:acyl-CoA thioesterase FadM